MGLLLPAVQQARESGRRAQCLNNIKQLSLACLQHEERTRRFPSGGWGPLWVGDPDRGNGIGAVSFDTTQQYYNAGQPGGWIYNILPYIEQQQLHDQGIGSTAGSGPDGSATGDQPSAKLAASQLRCSTQLSGLVCPTRRSGALLPVGTEPSTLLPGDGNGNASGPDTPAWTPAARQPYETNQLTAQVGRSDYAMNCGVRYTLHGGGSAGVVTIQKTTISGTTISPNLTDIIPDGCELQQGEYPTDLTTATKNKSSSGSGNFQISGIDWLTYVSVPWTGIGFPRSAIGTASIKDGLSQTYLCGEKYMMSDHYDDGADGGDNDTAYSGFGNDLYRSTDRPPQNDQRSVPRSCRFGGPHSGIVNMAFCDGSVRGINVGIDQTTNRNLGDRNDGQRIDESRDVLIGPQKFS